jgi:chaperonin GroES
MSTALKAKPAITASRTIRLQPLEDRVIIRAFDEAEPMHGRLYIQDTAKEKPTRGEVLAVGPGRLEKGQRVPTGISVGEVVLYGAYSGTPFQVDDEELLIVKASDILARIG